jgi:Uma2 family endonuclease
MAAPSDLPLSPSDGLEVTLAEFRRLPFDKPYLELHEGRVRQKPWRDRANSSVFGALMQVFDQYAKEQGGDGYTSIDMVFNDRDFRVIDVAYWSPDRRLDEESYATPPTAAIELTSEDRPREEFAEKCRFYRSHGVDVCWLIDPEARTAEVFEGDRDAEPIPADGALETSFMPGFSLALGDLFAVLDR